MSGGNAYERDLEKVRRERGRLNRAADAGDFSEWLTLPQVAGLLGLDTHTSLYTTVRRGTLPARKFKGRVMVSPVDAEQYRLRHSYTRRSDPGGEG